MAVEFVDDQEMREAQRDYLDFLDDDQDQGIYQSKVRQMISENKSRLIVNLNDLRRRNEQRAAKLLNNAFEELLAFQRALKDLVASIDATYAKQHEEFFIGLEGSFGSKHVSPRTLTSRLLGSMVCLEGIVTKCSLVRPKVVRSVHYCPATKKTMERKYTDMTSLDAFPSSAIYPTKDEENNPLETEFGLSIYKDHQTITVQEMPEKAPAGQLPRSVDIILDNDLVDVVKPGDRTQVIGTYRCLPGKKGGFTSGTFRTIMIACHVKQMSKEVSHYFSADDVAKIKSFCRTRSKNSFDQLARSLAPSIHGHEYIKKAILCMLLGGVEKVLENGSRIRGDINVLLIGDPSVAKSQLLRYVLHTAPRAIPTTGRGSSGVGLTAAVTTDQETGERRLEAGAMVLGDRGVVCIDEFDKMSDMDRTAIHEVMEQGRVTIAKAGIHARLNARCSVLAAANPVYGRVSFISYLLNEYIRPLFPIHQVLEKERKRSRNGEQDAASEEEEEDEVQDTPQTQRKRRRHSERRASQGSEPYDPYDFNTETDVPQIQSPAPARQDEELIDAPGQNGHTELSDGRLKEFKTALLEVFRSSHAQSVGMITLMEGINKSCPSPFKETEVRAALSRMQDDNQVMVADDIIFLI
uniref:DNA replication licensing factor MCM3 n=1 Tax=Sinocyclocheilus grahami TaxID=75366 RepID=A0A672R2F7_SINGR